MDRNRGTWIETFKSRIELQNFRDYGQPDSVADFRLFALGQVARCIGIAALPPCRMPDGRTADGACSSSGGPAAEARATRQGAEARRPTKVDEPTKENGQSWRLAWQLAASDASRWLIDRDS